MHSAWSITETIYSANTRLGIEDNIENVISENEEHIKDDISERLFSKWKTGVIELILFLICLNCLNNCLKINCSFT